MEEGVVVMTEVMEMEMDVVVEMMQIEVVEMELVQMEVEMVVTERSLWYCGIILKF